MRLKTIAVDIYRFLRKVYVLNKFDIVWDCSARRRHTATVCGMKINLPSCVARNTAMICGQKINSCTAVYTVFGSKLNSALSPTGKATADRKTHAFAFG